MSQNINRGRAVAPFSLKLGKTKVLMKKNRFNNAAWSLGLLMTSMVVIPHAALAQQQVLKMYNWTDYTPADLLAKFEKETGIKVQLDTYDSNETLLAKLKAGGTSYDIFVPTQSYVQIMAKAGLIQKIDIKSMPNYKYVDKKYQNPEWDPNQEYTVPWQLGFTAYSYRTALYKGKGNSWQEIFEPGEEYRGKISMMKSPDEVIDAALIYTGGKLCSENPDDYKKVQELLLKQKPFVRVYSSENINERMKSGEVAMTMNWDGNTKRAQIDEGMPDAKLAFPKEGVVGFFDNVVVSSKTKNKEAAMKFMNFIMAPENMAMISNAQGYANAIPNSRKYFVKSMKTAQALNPPSKMPIYFVNNPCGKRAVQLKDKVWTALQK